MVEISNHTTIYDLDQSVFYPFYYWLIAIYTFQGEYKTTVAMTNKAEYTSNLESDNETQKRQRKAPSRLVEQEVSSNGKFIVFIY